MMTEKLAILYGGPSSEYNVSLDTKDCLLDLYKEYNPLAILWNKDFTFTINNENFSEKDFLEYISENDLIVIIAAHGEYAEDGYIQSLFEDHNIKFTGSDSVSCELAMDKFASQNAVSEIANLIPTHLDPSELGFPFIAKPNNLGSSVGVQIIRNKNEYEQFKKYNLPDYIFQKYIIGTEVSMGTVRKNGGFLKLYPTEIIPKKEFFDYEAKYSDGMSEEITPARITDKQTTYIQNTANQIHEELGLGYYSRSDFIIGDDGIIYYLETNALPGFTKNSLLPKQLRYSNLLEEFKNGLIHNLVH